MSDPEQLIYPDFSWYREKAQGYLELDGFVPFTKRECAMIGFMCSHQEHVNHGSTVGTVLCEELDRFNLPKWVTVISWLSPWGVCSADPELTLRLLKYLFGDTRREEEQLVPQEFREAMLGVEG